MAITVGITSNYNKSIPMKNMVNDNLTTIIINMLNDYIILYYIILWCTVYIDMYIDIYIYTYVYIL